MPQKKWVLINQVGLFMVLLVALLFQNQIGPVLLGFHIPLFIWIPFVVYGALYRGEGLAMFGVYLISLTTASLSSIHFVFLLIFNGFLTFLLLIFKKFYSVSWLFFSLICALALLLFPLFLFLFPRLIEEPPYTYKPLFWIGGGVVSWLITYPCFHLLTVLDKWTYLRPIKRKKKQGVI